MRKIIFFKTQDNKSPVEDFLDSLPSKHAQKVVWVLKIIEDLDIVPKQYFKKLVGTNNIWEVRISISGKIYRILGFFHKNNAIILNHGFTKKSQKTPKKEIEIAEKRKKIYLENLTNE